MVHGTEQRRFIRHPTDIPIEVELADVVSSRSEYLKDISEGGLCFKSAFPLEKGTLINIRIPLVHPVFEATGCVAWCRHAYDHYDVGVEFTESRAVFRVRMVEQVCHIEHYKREVLEREGRTLTSDQAAMEWIDKFAKDFPRPETRGMGKG